MGGAVQERRAARRFEARHVAGLQFVIPLSGLREVDGAGAGEFFICVEVTEAEGAASGRWASHIRRCAPAPAEDLS